MMKISSFLRRSREPILVDAEVVGRRGSRPGRLDDNPYSEALVRSLKPTSAYAAHSFQSASRTSRAFASDGVIVAGHPCLEDPRPPAASRRTDISRTHVPRGNHAGADAWNCVQNGRRFEPRRQLRNSDHPDRRNRRMAITETGHGDRRNRASRSPKPVMAIA